MMTTEPTTTYVTNGVDVGVLPKVFFHDFNDGKLRCLTHMRDKPEIGERVILRDWSNEFQTECVVTNTTHIAHHIEIYVELKRIGPFEYL